MITTTGPGRSRAVRRSRRRTFMTALTAAIVLLGLTTTSGAAAKRLVISDIASSNVTETSATISWTTNGRATGVINYGTTPDYGSQVTAATYSSSQSVTLTGLAPGTQYFFQVEATAKSGRTATPQTGSFITNVDEPPPPPPPSGDSFSCLTDSNYTYNNHSWNNADYVGRIRLRWNDPDLDGDPNTDIDPGTAFDLTNTTVSVHDQADDEIVNDKPKIDSRWGLIQVDNTSEVCIAGGHVTSPNPYNITWDENYDRDGLGFGYRIGTTDTHAAIELKNVDRPLVTGTYFFNLHDGIRVTRATDWRVQHVWGEYNRDDCIENDLMASGVIADSLFDGCYAGYSNETDSATVPAGSIVTFDNVLMRMEMMPGPHKACERTYKYFDAERKPYTTSPCVERQVYGTDAVFKVNKTNNVINTNNPRYRLIDSVFVVEQYPAGDPRADFPTYANQLEECYNVTIIYLGEGAYPGDVPDCATVYLNGTGLDLWQQEVTAWHQTHGDVAPDRKAEFTYGDVTFPRPPFNAPETN